VAYPDDLLGEDEHVIIHKHPHWKMLVVPVLVLIVVAGAGAYLATLAVWTPVWVAVGVVGAILLLWLVLPRLVRWRSTHFVVTTHRLMNREGVFTRTGLDIPISRINSVRFRHGLLDRMVGCGTLIVESASEEPLEFDEIPKVEQVHTLLYREIYRDSEGDHHMWREEH
jgi:membrane protein YdbS with pleckstrin-like domain